MEEWFETTSYCIMAYEATAVSTLKVMSMLMQARDLTLRFDSISPEATRFIYIEDLTDAIAYRLFPGNGALDKLESFLFNQTPQDSVYTAFSLFRRIQETYTYMCVRQGQHLVIGEHQFVTISFSLLPKRISDIVKRVKPEVQWNFEEL